MPTRTRVEIDALARNIVNMVIAQMLLEFPAIASAMRKTKDKPWCEFVDEQVEEVSDVLVRCFGASDV